MTPTRGTWKMDVHTGTISQYPYVYSADEHGNTIGEICHPEAPQTGGMEEAGDNARLIAAAPALLEACKYVVKYHREHDSGEGELFGLDFVTTCICAIRTAEGEWKL